jgi:8-amino-7-oxononanoate synthase
VAAVDRALADWSAECGGPGEAGLGEAGPGRGRRALVLTESVYSVLGDAAPLAELAAVCERHEAVLVVDEAHALGCVGPGGAGLVAAAGLAGRADVVMTATLSKSLGSQGGVVLAHPLVREHLINRARPFIYDTGLAPAAAVAAQAALRIVRTEPERVARLARVAARLARAAGVPTPAGVVLSVPVAGPREAVAAAEACAAAGIRVGVFRPPSVPDGVSRLRLTARATLTDAALEWAAEVLAAALAGIRWDGTGSPRPGLEEVSAR